MKIRLLILYFITFSASIFSQTYTWNGAANDNLFFNEANWIDSNTGLAPIGNPINGGTAINRPFIISNVSTTITAASEINLGSTGSLTITNATITANSIRGGIININESGYLNLEISGAFKTTSQINLNSGIAWVRTKLIAPSLIQSTYLSQFKVNNVAASYPTNLRLDNYYFGGTVIRSQVASTSPVTLYDRKNTTGTSVSLAINTIHSGTAITNLNNKTESFILKKGFMLTIADNEDGTGKSKNYIASEQDMTVNELPVYLLNNVSFVRVIPWNWVSKKGIGGDVTGLDNTWFYRWANDGISTVDVENAPMAWGVSAADDDADINIYKTKYKATHVMGFNEPDDCGAQSGQYRNLCQEDVAVGYYRNLMKSGLRLVSPGGREEAPSGWLQSFYNKATVQDIRIDVIAVHWYDWGGIGNVNDSASNIFNRFKNYLTDVYNRFGKPIWITEFNANPGRNNATNLAFMQLALPYLETLDYVERYAWFEPNSTPTRVADYYDANNVLTNVGTYYKGFTSTASIPENTLAETNNIDDYHIANPNFTHNLLTNGDFKTGDLRAWVGSNSQSILDSDNTNIANRNTTPDITKNVLVGNINSGSGNLSQIIEVGPGITYNVSFDYKWVSLVNTNSATVNVYSGTTGTSTSFGSTTLNTTPNVWYKANFICNVTTASNAYKARLLINKTSGDPLRVDNVKITVISNKTWKGATNSDWNTASNWVGNIVPATTDIVFIPRGLTNYPTVSGDITLKRLFIDSGASFISSGDVIGTETYFADLNDDKWHLISAPFQQTMNSAWVSAAGIAVGNVDNTNIAIGSYDNGIPNDTGSWRYFKSTDAASAFTNGKGYAMKKLSKGMFIFNGNIVSGTKNIPITKGTGTGSSGWNLIGNPFPSSISINSFLNTNVSQLHPSYAALYVWNAETENYEALNSEYVNPGQAFFVNANSSTNVSVSQDMLSNQNNVLFYKSEAVNNLSIKLRISDGTNTKETEINYESGKTKGLDPRFDIGLFDGIASDFNIYTHLLAQNEGIPFMKQALPNTEYETMVVPIGIKSGAKEITFSANATHLPEGILVFLEDKQTNTVTRLDETNATYKITLSESIDITGRFYLHTKSSGVLSTEEVDLQNISIYKTANSTLKIVGLTSGKANIQLFNILGKQVMTANFEANNSNELSLPKLASGVYFVKLKHEKGNLTQKIILE